VSRFLSEFANIGKESSFIDVNNFFSKASSYLYKEFPKITTLIIFLAISAEFSPKFP